MAISALLIPKSNDYFPPIPQTSHHMIWRTYSAISYIPSSPIHRAIHSVPLLTPNNVHSQPDSPPQRNVLIPFVPVNTTMRCSAQQMEDQRISGTRPTRPTLVDRPPPRPKSSPTVASPPWLGFIYLFPNWSSVKRGTGYMRPTLIPPPPTTNSPSTSAPI